MGKIVNRMDGGAQYSDPVFDGTDTATTPGNITYINESGLRDELVEEWMGGRRARNEIASVIEQWTQELQGSSQRTSLDLFNRTKWENKGHAFAVMSQCAWSVENDDILSTLADVIEGLMWQKCRFELFDPDQQSMWNQWAKDVNLDKQLRAMGREEFKVSQFYVGMLWEKKVYEVQEDPIDDTIKEFEAEEKEREHQDKVDARLDYIQMNSHQPGYIEPPEIPNLEQSGPGRGNRKRKKKFPVEVPTAMTIFDPTKVVPVGSLLFGRERLAYVAERGEDEAFTQVMSGEASDPTAFQLIEGKYTPTPQDRVMCADLGIDPNRLWLFKPDAVFRHTLTKADYERFGPVRLKPILPILEMKDHLRASERATLIGTTNFIVVITKGSDKLPAKQSEINNLQEQARSIARIPVMIGDHRLNVEIVAPNSDHTLTQSRWEVLDSRLVFKALQSYAPVVQGGNSSGTGVSEMSRVIAKGMESRRHMVVRTLEAKVFTKVMERNEGVLDEFPSLAFTPKRIALDFNAEIVTQILKLRDRGDISRETSLEELDYDQDVEVLRRARERAQYDRVFESQTPYGSPATNPYGTPAPPQMQPGGPGTPGSGMGANGLPAGGKAPKEGGRPAGVKEEEPRKPAAKK